MRGVRWGRGGRIAAASLSGLAAGLIGTGCAEGGPGTTWTGTVDTLAGGGVRVVSPAQGLWTPETAWRLQEDLRIGSLEGEGPQLLGEIGDVSVDADGRIYVLEQQAQEIRVFDAEGSWVRTIGRPGEGPGELNVPFGGEVFFGPDGRVVVNNSMNRRWEVFTVDGEFLTSTPHGSSYFGGNTVAGEDGALYKRDIVRPPGGGESSSVIVRLVVRGDSLIVTDTLEAPALPDGETVQVSLTTGSGGSISMRLPVPFVHQPGWSFSPAGHFWVEPGTGYRLVALDRDLDTLRVVERAYEPVPVSDAEMDEALERFTSGELAGSGADVDRSRIPDHHPAFARYLEDTERNLWVRRTLGNDRWAWDVFDRDGRYLGAVSTEVDLDRLNVQRITADAVYGVFRGELDEPYVVRLAIVKGGGETTP